MPKMTTNELRALLAAERMDSLSAIMASKLSAERMDSLSAIMASKLSAERASALAYYQGDMAKEMPAPEGRSSAVSMDVADTIEGLMPSRALNCGASSSSRVHRLERTMILSFIRSRTANR